MFRDDCQNVGHDRLGQLWPCVFLRDSCDSSTPLGIETSNHVSRRRRRKSVCTSSGFLGHTAKTATATVVNKIGGFANCCAKRCARFDTIF